MDGSSFLASFSSDHEIRFNGGTIDSFPVKGEKVTILPSPDDHELGSSKLKISNIVNYGWDHRYHAGQLVAVHKAGTFFAYGILTPGKTTGVVRVVQRESEERVLLKGMKGKVKDMAFAHCTDSVILGVVDEFANLFVYRIEENPSDKSLKPEMVLQIDSEAETSGTDLKHLRLIWCPYLPEEDNEEDAPRDDSSSRLLVVTKNNQADLFNVDMVVNEYGNGPLESSTIVCGRLKISDHRGPITDASFSPDGTAIATASTDGQVKFFQVYMHGKESPRCLHQWSPHDGKPLSSLFFLDNHLNYNPEEQFWKFAITGANRNTELKVWNCATWTCLQTIKFASSTSMELKAAMDLSAKFILLSDIHRKIVYVLKLDEFDSVATVVSVSEFATPSAFLSMAVVEACLKRIKKEQNDVDDEDHTDSDDDDDDEGARDLEKEESNEESTFIRFMLIQPKSLQECTIVYEDASQKSNKTFEDILSTIKQENPLLDTKPKVYVPSPSKIMEAEMSKNNGLKKVIGLNGKDREVYSGSSGDLQQAADKITLMSPEVFEVKPKIKEEPRDAENQNLLTTPNSSGPHRGATLNYRQLLAGASGTSSPSREVADILGGEDGDDEIDLNVEYVVTGDNDDDDDEEDDDDDSDDVNIYDEIAIKKEEEEFANLDRILMKQEVKTEEETEDTEDDQENPLQTSARIKQEPIMTTPSAPPRIKQESLLGSPAATSLSLIKQEPPQITHTASLLIKQEPESNSTFMTPPANVMLSRSFDHSSLDQLNINQQMNILMKKLNDMTAIIQTQRAEMTVLREEVRALHSNDLKQVENMIIHASKSQTLQLAESSKRDAKTLMSNLSQSVNGTLGNQLEREVKSLAPYIAKLTAETVQQHLNKEVKSRLTAADDTLREAITKMAQSKPALEALGQALALAVQPVLQSAFKDMFITVLVPGFERSTQNLFTSVATTFNKGCKEYEGQLKQHVGKQLEPVAKDIRETAAKLSAKEAQHQSFDKSLRDLEANLKEIVMQEVRQALVIHSANITRSLSATPTLAAKASLPATTQTLQELQATITTLIGLERWNEAFQTSLMANNLQLVVSTCETVNPMKLFSQDICPLSQSVLLSLIQQLGHNLEEKTEVKFKYLEEAITNLDTTNPATRQHLSNIVGRLQKQLDNFIKTNPDKKITRSMKVLHMATQSLIGADK